METAGKRKNLGLYPRFFGFPFYYGIGLFAGYGLSLILIVSKQKFFLLILMIIVTIIIKVLMGFFHCNDILDFSKPLPKNLPSVFYDRGIKKILNRSNNEV